MTLYLLFEKLDRGAMTLGTEIPISQHAAAQEPSKLGLRPGDTITVEDAIKAVVTRSANDVAVAIAEAVGQTEDNFADMMTRKARELGMASTLYRNASGLPNDEQVTTAHDLTILGRTLEERFPRYFHYFSTAEFDYDREVIGNHNHLLGRVQGVDGIKTGYTRASGFNLLTSVHRDGRSLIAVVMGGRSAAGRDRIMENLIADHLAEASTTRSATMIADAAPAPADQPNDEPAAAPRPAVAAGGRIQQVSAATSAANAAGEGDDGTGDEKIAAPQPMLKAPGAAPALGAANGRRSEPPQKVLHGQAARENPGPARRGERAGHAARWTARPGRRPAPSGARFPARRGQRQSFGAPELDDPDRRHRRPGEGERPFDPRPGTQQLDPRRGEAGHRAGAQGRRYGLPGALCDARFSVRRICLPLPQTQRIFLLPRSGLTLFEAVRLSGASSSLVVASEHPWPD